MEWANEVLHEVGTLTEDNTLVRGVLTVGAASLAVLLTGWRALRRKKEEVPRVKIDAPSNVQISVNPVNRGERYE